MAKESKDISGAGPAAVSAIFLKTRREKKLEIDDVVKNTKIRGVYIKAIEEANYDALPGGFYTRGYVKSYADYLKLNSKEIMNIFDAVEEEQEQEQEPEKKQGGGFAVPKRSSAGAGVNNLADKMNFFKPKNKKARGTEGDMIADADEHKFGPSPLVIIASIITVMFVYAVWSLFVDISDATDERGTRVLSTFSDSEHTIALVANKDVNLFVKDNLKKTVFSGTLRYGDTFFIPESGMIVGYSNKEAVEIYVDGERVVSTDNLESVAGGLELDINKLLANTAIN